MIIKCLLKSNRCSLWGMKPKELVKHHEEVEEMGGYFIINGIEKIARMLIMQRRNYVSTCLDDPILTWTAIPDLYPVW